MVIHPCPGLDLLYISHKVKAIVSSQKLVRKRLYSFIAVISTLIISSSSITNHGYFEITKVASAQTAPDQTNPNSTNLVDIQDIPFEKVRVGDIDIAYKMFGKGDPIILHNGTQPFLLV